MLQNETPVAGFYKRKFIRGGVWTGIHIERHCKCSINGGEDQPSHIWNETCDRFPELSALVDGFSIESAENHFMYCFGHEITEAEYRQLVKMSEWSERNDPEDPHASKKAVNHMKIKPLF